MSSAYQNAIGAEVPVKLNAAGAVPVAVAGTGYSAQINITRPANVIAYTAGDVCGEALAAITFPNTGPANGSIIITDADLRVDVAAIPAGMTSFRLHLYNATPPSALADNAVWDLPAGDRAAYLGYIDIGAPLDVGSTLYVQTDGLPPRVYRMGASTSLFGYLVTNSAFTPSSATVKTVRINAVGA